MKISRRSDAWAGGCWMIVVAVLSALQSVSVARAADTAAPQTVLAESVRGFVDREELAGAVMLVANRDQVLATAAVGWADVARRKPMSTDSLFWIASQSKPITAAAVMILVDEGKIRLDDPLEKHLPEFRGQMVVAERDDQHVLLRRPKRVPTIRDALRHTSGMPFKSALEEPTLDLYPLAARVRSYAMTPLEYEPGEKYLYSNAGINTAARIIEVVTGESFEAFLESRLLRQLGMNDTSFWVDDQQAAARVALAYKPGADKKGLVETPISQLLYPLSDRTRRFPMPAGGLFSTAHDLARFYRMLLNQGELEGKRVLSAEAVRELTSRQTPEELKTSYGLGFAVGKDTFGHGGAYSTNSTAHLQQGLVTIWLVQHAGFPGNGEQSQATFVKAAQAHFVRP